MRFYYVQHYRLPRKFYKLARNDREATTASLRGANKMRDEAIHNIESHFKDSIAIINLAHYYGLPRKFYKLARNDERAESTNTINHARNDREATTASLRGANKMRDEAIHNQTQIQKENK